VITIIKYYFSVQKERHIAGMVNVNIDGIG
jgi:hypothetical protein